MLSILVTVYNRETYLGESLKSILSSSYTSFELIVVDDASTDGSLTVAQEFARIDSRVKIVKNAQNLGDYANRNMAASLATGRWIKYLDSDDLIYPHSLEIMMESFRQHPAAAIALAHSMPEDESPYPWQLTSAEAYRKHFLGRGCLSCGPSGAIIRREAFEAVGGFRPKWNVLADADLWLRLAARWPIILLPPGLVWWRRHEDQEFSRGDAASIYLERGFQLAREALTSPECPLTQSERATALTKVRQQFARRLLSLAIRGRRLGSALEMYRHSDLTLAELASGFRSYRSGALENFGSPKVHR